MIGVIKKSGLEVIVNALNVAVLLKTTAITISDETTTNEEIKLMKAILRDPNLTNFMSERKLNIKITSDAIQFLPVKYQVHIKPTPRINPIISMILTLNLPLT